MGELGNSLFYIFSRAVELDRPAILRWESWLAVSMVVLPIIAIVAVVFAGRVAIDALRSKEVAG